jgi:hypothetical protein
MMVGRYVLRDLGRLGADSTPMAITTPQEHDLNRQKRWLHEHLSYELLMVRHTYKQLTASVETGREQLAWNANFVAFAVYARNLYDFLTNDKDSRIFKAEDYVSFDADKRPISGIMNNLHQQALHPGKQRIGGNDASKVGFNKVKMVNAWVEENMKNFIAKLEQPYADIWKPEMADPAKVAERTIRVDLPQENATNHPGTWVTKI